MAKRKRWKCPHCGSGKLAPSRPRSDDVRRYCLRCSERTGRLVKRTCPALDKQRAHKEGRAAARRVATRAKRAADPKVKLAQLFRQFQTLACWRDDVAHATLDLRVKRNTKAPNAWFTPGTARLYSGRITMTIGTCWADTRATLLHELAHVCQGRRRTADSGHGDQFRSIYREAIDELLGEHYEPTERGLEHIHYMDRDVAEAFRRQDNA